MRTNDDGLVGTERGAGQVWKNFLMYVTRVLARFTPVNGSPRGLSGVQLFGGISPGWYYYGPSRISTPNSHSLYLKATTISFAILKATNSSVPNNDVASTALYHSEKYKIVCCSPTTTTIWWSLGVITLSQDSQQGWHRQTWKKYLHSYDRAFRFLMVTTSWPHPRPIGVTDSEQFISTSSGATVRS
jgi:hypothetical protein